MLHHKSITTLNDFMFMLQSYKGNQSQWTDAFPGESDISLD